MSWGAGGRVLRSLRHSCSREDVFSIKAYEFLFTLEISVTKLSLYFKKKKNKKLENVQAIMQVLAVLDISILVFPL